MLLHDQTIALVSLRQQLLTSQEEDARAYAQNAALCDTLKEALEELQVRKLAAEPDEARAATAAREERLARERAAHAEEVRTMNAEIADVRERRGRAKDAFEAELNEKAELTRTEQELRAELELERFDEETRAKLRQGVDAEVSTARDSLRSAMAEAMKGAAEQTERALKSQVASQVAWAARELPTMLHGETQKFLAQLGGAHAEIAAAAGGLPADAGPALAAAARQKAVRLQDPEAAHVIAGGKILLAAAEGVDVTGAAEESGPLVEKPVWALSDDEVPPLHMGRSRDKDSTPGSTPRRRDRDACAAAFGLSSAAGGGAAGDSLEAAQDALVLAAQHAAASRDSRDPMARARGGRAPPRRRAGRHRRRLALRWRRAVGGVGASSVGGGAAAVGRMGAAARRVPASAARGLPAAARRVPTLPLPGLPAATKLRVPARRRGGRAARRGAARLAAHALAVCRRHRRRTGGGTGGGGGGVGPAEPGGGGGGRGVGVGRERGGGGGGGGGVEARPRPRPAPLKGRQRLLQEEFVGGEAALRLWAEARV